MDRGRQGVGALRVVEKGAQAVVERLHVTVDQPAHARPAPLSLVVHDPDEGGVAGHEVHVGADQPPQPLALVADAGVGEGGIEAAAQLAEGALHGGPP